MRNTLVIDRVVHDHYYSVGRLVDTDEPVLIVTVTSVAWKDYVFSLSNRQFQDAIVDPKQLNALVDVILANKGKGEWAKRYLFEDPDYQTK